MDWEEHTPNAARGCSLSARSNRLEAIGKGSVLRGNCGIPLRESGGGMLRGSQPIFPGGAPAGDGPTLHLARRALPSEHRAALLGPERDRAGVLPQRCQQNESRETFRYYPRHPRNGAKPAERLGFLCVGGRLDVDSKRVV
jgi:hypothetical protein